MNQFTTQSLYDQDFALWIDDTVAKLKARKFEQIDLENLIEEMQSLGRSDKRELKNRLAVLLAHLLKRIYVGSTYDNRGWMNTIVEQRRQLRFLLEESPSLKGYFLKVFSEMHCEALEAVRNEYLGVVFPDEWQFERDVDAILNEKFWRN